MKQTGICKLCLKEKKLLKRSHIIPDFMYKEIYDSQHKIYKFSISDSGLIDKELAKQPTGEYEGGILCRKCDNDIIGGYEDYASKVLYGGTLSADECPVFKSYRNKHGVEYSVCKQVSYKKFKLFLLSILWRASISKREFFSVVSLGPYEEPIREMIYTGDPKEPEDFPILMRTYRNNKSVPKEFIMPPSFTKKDGNIMYKFQICGMEYFFSVSKHKAHKVALSYTINKNNELTIFHVPKGKAEKNILQLLGVKA